MTSRDAAEYKGKDVKSWSHSTSIGCTEGREGWMEGGMNGIEGSEGRRDEWNRVNEGKRDEWNRVNEGRRDKGMRRREERRDEGNRGMKGRRDEEKRRMQGIEMKGREGWKGRRMKGREGWSEGGTMEEIDGGKEERRKEKDG